MLASQSGLLGGGRPHVGGLAMGVAFASGGLDPTALELGEADRASALLGMTRFRSRCITLSGPIIGRGVPLALGAYGGRDRQAGSAESGSELGFSDYISTD